MATLHYVYIACILRAFSRTSTIPFNAHNRQEWLPLVKLNVLNKNVLKGISLIKQPNTPQYWQPFKIRNYTWGIIQACYWTNSRLQILLALILVLHHLHWGHVLPIPRVPTWSIFISWFSPGSAHLMFVIYMILFLFLAQSDCSQSSSCSLFSCAISSSPSFWILMYLFWAHFSPHLLLYVISNLLSFSWLLEQYLKSSEVSGNWLMNSSDQNFTFHVKKHCRGFSEFHDHFRDLWLKSQNLSPI